MKNDVTRRKQNPLNSYMSEWLNDRGKTFIHTIMLILILSSLTFAQFKLPAYEKTILENGITLYLMEQHEVPLIYISAIFPAGAIWDEGQSGLAALTAEALLFGSKNYTKQQIEETFDFLGASITSSAGKESSVIKMSCNKTDLDKLLPIFIDVITHPAFPREEIDKRKQRWLAELEQDKQSPRRVIGNHFNKFLFGTNVYGNPVSGTLFTVKEITNEDIAGFFGMHYLHTFTGIAVVGDFTTAKMKTKMENLLPQTPSFEKLNLMKDLDKDIKHLDNSRVLLINKDDSRETTFLIGGYGVAWNNKDLIRIDVVNTILGGRFTSWLNDALRINAGLTYGVRSLFNNYRQSGTFYIFSFTATKNTVDAIDLALKVLYRLHTEGIDSVTLVSAKNYIKGQFPPEYETSGDLADLLTTMFFYGIDDSYINDFETTVDQMTVANANEIANKYFPKENLQFVLIGKASEIRDKIKKYGSVIEKNIEDDGY
jgi:zinc protease